jgi:hypothetical protein
MEILVQNLEGAVVQAVIGVLGEGKGVVDLLADEGGLLELEGIRCVGRADHDC